jgi:hypothetical protein
MTTFKSFVKQISLVGAIVLLLSIAIDLWVGKIPISPAYPYIFVFLFLTTVVVFRTIANSMEKRLSRFANVYMLANFGKLLLFTIIIVAYSFLNPEDAIAFMLTFFSYYFVFTNVEIIALLRIKK